MSLALALKYRPQLFSDLVGQEAISQTLGMALDKNRIVHAYLFSGLRGSGKTSSARIFARALECERGPISTPCGECDICKATLEGRNIDIIEMDAASNRSIDNIRDLIEQTKYAPAMARFKIFIIDEVHMLTKEAFNALLKTLEEPPQYVKFILATTDPLKLPATILSRTQHFRFKKIPHRLVVAHLKMILQKEEVGYDDGALEIIARAGGGSLRDTLTLTDQAINYCDKFLTTQQVTQMLGVVDPQVLKNFFGSILHNDEEGLKRDLEALSEYECEMIIDEMLLFLKDALFGGSKDFPLLLLDRFLGILSRAKSLLNLNPDGAFVLTLISLKMREAMKLKDINEAIQSLESALAKNSNLQITSNTASATSNLSQNLAQTSAMAMNDFASQKSSHSQESLNLQESSQGDLAQSGDSILGADSLLQNSQPPQNPQNLQNPQDLQNQVQNHINASVGSIDDKAKFDELVKRIYDRSYELGEVFSVCVEFERVDSGVLYWKSNPNAQQKEQLKRGYSVIVLLAKEVFGEVEIKNTYKDFAKSNEQEAQANTQNARSNAASAEMPPQSTENTESADSANADMTQDSAQNLTQKFLSENKELIASIKENFGAKEMRVQND
ncbi:DNA polymerase III subunit gamma/tau [Helicobacter macacae]|uniref:DNA polymerase III subunit gamma/tau n=1 Tax=Helicobacter macacae MIT 99-5501 TaxID=1357400 RepID=V8CDN4_9HELI|nr:DNA polymerase III subunit gamma/tau [Helicobacter macacae]ETD25130.1 DNA polymerase III, subunit gamma and tau [Helicobacter macacae MIT 99-5501]